MTATFADTAYFVALLNPRDEHHQAACQLATSLIGPMTTTAWVIAEVANQMSRPPNRTAFLSFLRDLEDSDRVEIVPPTQELFKRGLELYADRRDKEWSLTDCISFVVMERDHLMGALTADHHFEQAGFTILMK